MLGTYLCLFFSLCLSVYLSPDALPIHLFSILSHVACPSPSKLSYPDKYSPHSYISAITEVITDPLETCNGTAGTDMGEARLDIINTEVNRKSFFPTKIRVIKYMCGYCNSLHFLFIFSTRSLHRIEPSVDWSKQVFPPFFLPLVSNTRTNTHTYISFLESPRRRQWSNTYGIPRTRHGFALPVDLVFFLMRGTIEHWIQLHNLSLPPRPNHRPDLGWYDSESYGIAYKVRGFCIDHSNPEIFEDVAVTGNILGSHIHHLYFGHYSFGHQGGNFSFNEVCTSIFLRAILSVLCR